MGSVLALHCVVQYNRLNSTEPEKELRVCNSSLRLNIVEEWDVWPQGPRL
jgi:hypothetical protein